MTGPKLHISLLALVENWRRLARAAPGAEAAAVVKADAYGLGVSHVARALADAGCRRFYVAWPKEGAELREIVGADPQIAVFHGPDAHTLPLFTGADLQPVLNSLDQIALWTSFGGGAFALHVDTGMNRLGIHARDWAVAKAALGDRQPTHLVSHLACPDDPIHPLNARQLALYQTAFPLWPTAKRSLAATSGVYLGRDYTFDEIRPGIGLYGGGGQSQPVVRLTAPILQVRRVAASETTGYGATWASDADRQLATIGLGYADGFLRAASNSGYGVIQGQVRPIVGRVSMDLLMLDTTGLDVKAGDEAEFLGPAMPIADQADAMATIDYEILTRLGRRFTRVYEGAA